MGSEGMIIERVLGTVFSDYDRRTGDNKTKPKNSKRRQFARPQKVSVLSIDSRMRVNERLVNQLF